MQDRIGEVPASDGPTGLELAAVEARPQAESTDDLRAVLQALARTILNFRRYPHNSPLCTESVRETHTALLRIRHHDTLVFQVNADGVFYDECLIPDVLIKAELAARLHRADVSLLEIDRDATPRDITQFARELAKLDTIRDNTESFSMVLSGKGLERIKVTVIRRVEVVRTQTITAQRAALITECQRQREIATQDEAAVGHLFTPETGWVRIDPGLELEKVEIADLAVLVGDPKVLARALFRLSDESVIEGSDAGHDEALVQKFSEVARLYASFEPQIMELMFKRLAESVLDLEPGLRKRLLRMTVLPGLLDDTIDGSVMRHFPDIDIADSLALLLDLQIAAPEVVSVGLERLDLGHDRSAAIAPLLEERIEAHRNAEPEADEDEGPGDLEGRTHQLLQVDGSVTKDFSEFTAFDLSVDRSTAYELVDILMQIKQTDSVTMELACQRNLLRVTADPDVAEATLDRAYQLLLGLERSGRLADLATWAGHLEALIDRDPEEWGDTSELLVEMLTRCCSIDMLIRLARVDVEDPDEALKQGAAVLAGFGTAAAAAGLNALETMEDRSVRRRVVRMLCMAARSVAPQLSHYINHSEWYVARNIVAIVGHAGPGYETQLSNMLEYPHPKVVREAFLSLNRAGTIEAVDVVIGKLAHDSPEVRALAEEAIWRFESRLSHEKVVALLRHEPFVYRYPQLAKRLIDRGAELRMNGLAEAVKPLRRLRFQFWQPRLRRLGSSARKAGQS